MSGTFGSEDFGYFDYSDYAYSTTRLFRVNVTALVKANDHLAVLGDLETENFEAIRPYALYVRIRPWASRDIDIQAGRIPPTFGAFSRRTYVSDNPLIGYPLAYQYVTSLRPDALPATADELLQKRSLGWRARYTVGNPVADHGVPLASALKWDTGVQAHASFGKGRTLGVTASITNGTISNPLFEDDNGGKQLAGRVEWRPTPGLQIGTSAARGDFVSDSAANAASAVAPRPFVNHDFTQTAWGGDVEYSRDYFLVRAETVFSRWRVPFAAEPWRTDPLDAAATFIEGRYKIKPGLYAAARVDHLGFGSITGTRGRAPWDAPVTRVEVGGGYSLSRNLVFKASYQRNSRDGGRLPSGENLAATQVVFWF